MLLTCTDPGGVDNDWLLETGQRGDGRHEEMLA